MEDYCLDRRFPFGFRNSIDKSLQLGGRYKILRLNADFPAWIEGILSRLRNSSWIQEFQHLIRRIIIGWNDPLLPRTLSVWMQKFNVWMQRFRLASRYRHQSSGSSLENMHCTLEGRLLAPIQAYQIAYRFTVDNVFPAKRKIATWTPLSITWNENPRGWRFRGTLYSQKKTLIQSDKYSIQTANVNFRQNPLTLGICGQVGKPESTLAFPQPK